MSNDLGQDTAGDQPRAPENSAAPQEKRAQPRRESVKLKKPRSLERLRDRVKKAVQELERLQQENAALSARIQELETRPAIDHEGTLLVFDNDPDVLREKVEGFIEVIDAYLANENL